MGQMLVRNIEDDVLLRLKAKAKAEGLSLEEIARAALRNAAKPSRENVLERIDRIRSLSTTSSFDSTKVIREMRDRGWDGD